MNKVADFMTKEIFSKNETVMSIDAFGEILKSIPHIVDGDKFLFNTEDVREIRRIIGFFVSTQFGDYFLRSIGNTCVNDESTRIGFEYFMSINDINEFIVVCNLLDIGITLEHLNTGIQPAFIIYKKEGRE